MHAIRILHFSHNFSVVCIILKYNVGRTGFYIHETIFQIRGLRRSCCCWKRMHIFGPEWRELSWLTLCDSDFLHRLASSLFLLLGPKHYSSALANVTRVGPPRTISTPLPYEGNFTQEALLMVLIIVQNLIDNGIVVSEICVLQYFAH